MSGARILLVDDDPDITEFLSYNFEKEGFLTMVARNGEEAIEKASMQVFDLILLDIMMPQMDGMETCEKLRQLPSASESIIVFLTARGEDYSQIAGFEAGADDYITKPIKPKVLLSKIKAMIRRSQRKVTPENGADSETFNIDREKYIILKDGSEINLPKKEFELAALLIEQPGRVFGREHILNAVWGENVIVGDRTIDVHIRKIREKLGKEFFVTIKGVGYKFIEP